MKIHHRIDEVEINFTNPHESVRLLKVWSGLVRNCFEV